MGVGRSRIGVGAGAVTIGLLLFVVAGTVPATASGAAGGAAQLAVGCGDPVDGAVPETRDGQLSELGSVEGAPGMETYSEFELVRSQAVLAVQAGEFTDADRERNALVLRVLRSFERAYDCLADGEYEAALDAANETAALAADLSGEQGAQYQTMIDIGLDRFYEDAGGELLSVGERRESTPERIETLSKAAVAFREAGAADRFSRLAARLDEIEREYRADRDRIDESVAAGDRFAERCADCDDPAAALVEHGPAVFTHYRTGKGAEAEVDRARELLSKHGIDDPAVRETEAAVRERTAALAAASAALFVGWSLVVAAVAGFVASRLVAWRRDAEAASVGDVILLGGILDA